MLEPLCRQGRDPEGVGAPRDYIEKSGVDRVIVWNIYEVTGKQDRGRHLGGSAHGPANGPLYRMVSVAVTVTVTSSHPVLCAVDCGYERLGGTMTQGSWRWLRRAQALDAALADK